MPFASRDRVPRDPQQTKEIGGATSEFSLPASPVKSFFVEMLTRDISLDYAILDLLDNCVDGVQRTIRDPQMKSDVPYKGYRAKIEISEDSFVIEDNCGGIPWSLKDYAYRLGKPSGHTNPKGRKLVGIYGIGMKRAIFKIGENCEITTHAEDKSYRVVFSKEWMSDENEWNVPYYKVNRSKKRGTSVKVTRIRKVVSETFSRSEFISELSSHIQTHFAYIIQKGFSIQLNGKEITPRSINLIFSESKGSIQPFVYSTHHNGVDVFLAVGFSRPIPSADETDEAKENFAKEKYSSASAGWTVVCNDRAVLLYDKGPISGWGLSGVPQYHAQFNAISGIVMFSSEDPSLLPTTTTKRGIDVASSLYLHVRDKMMEGTQIFTQYTNQWKGEDLIEQSKREIKQTESVDIHTVRNRAEELSMRSVGGFLKGRQLKPTLPKPKKIETTARISFVRPKDEIRKVSEYLFGSAERHPKSVGEQCFQEILEEAGE